MMKKELMTDWKQAQVLRLMAERPNDLWLGDSLLPAIGEFIGLGVPDPDRELRAIMSGLCKPGCARVPGVALPVVTVAPMWYEAHTDRYALTVHVDVETALAYAAELEKKAAEVAARAGHAR